jgi:L-idonate 5-dehydrogenase
MINTEGVVAHAKGDLRVEHLTLPDPTPGECVVDVVYGGICGSDIHYWQHGAAGESILRAPMVLGHEVVGTVAQPAADGSGPVQGTRVAVHPATPGPGAGGRFPPDRPNLSPGVTYLGSAARFPHTDGALSRQAVLPSRMLRALPEALSWELAALTEPASVAWHAISRARPLEGRRVMVVGAGPIGLLIMAVAKRAGAAKIMAVDLHQRPLALARGLGATHTRLVGEAEAIDGADADVVIESSGSARGLASAVRGATCGGEVIMVGLLPAGDQPALISTAITRELELKGSFRFNDEIDEVIAALADGSLPVAPVVTHRFPLADALVAFETAADPIRSSKVLLDFRL